MNFTCARCRRSHAALPPEEPVQDRAQIAVLSAAWDEAYRRATARSRPLPTVAFVDSRFLQGQAAVRWAKLAREHLAAGRIEAAWGCLEGAAKRWERRKQLGKPSEWEKREAAEEKASMAYLVAMRRTGAWQVPPTLTSKRDTDGEWCLVCTEPCEARPRADKLKVNRPFHVILAYDIEGFHSALTSRTLADVRAQAERRSGNKQMGIIACTPPFEGYWAPGVFDRQGVIADVSAPAEWRGFLAVLEKPPKDEA